jgi:hypothetical protein
VKSVRGPLRRRRVRTGGVRNPNPALVVLVLIVACGVGSMAFGLLHARTAGPANGNFDPSSVGIAREGGRLLLISCRDPIGEASVLAGPERDSPLAWHAKLAAGRAPKRSLVMGAVDEDYEAETNDPVQIDGTYTISDLVDEQGVNLLAVFVPIRAGELADGQVATVDRSVSDLQTWRTQHAC